MLRGLFFRLVLGRNLENLEDSVVVVASVVW